MSLASHNLAMMDEWLTDLALEWAALRAEQIHLGLP